MRLRPLCIFGALIAITAMAVPVSANVRSLSEDGRSKRIVPGQYVISLQDGVIVDDFIREKNHGNGKGQTLNSVFRRTGNGYSVKFNNRKKAEEEVANLRADPRVRVIEQDVLVTLNSARPVNSWGLDRIDQALPPLDGFMRSDLQGVGVTVYVIDSGVRASSAEFGGRVRPGYSPDGSTDDCVGHGTHVAGTIAGANSGVAPRATIVASRAVDCNGEGTITDALMAIEWVIGDHQPGVPAVLNMSLGAPRSEALNDAVSNAAYDGIVPIVAAGNNGADACGESPGSAPNAITVAAADFDDQRAAFSNYGPCVSIFAPGDGILSAGIGSDSPTATASGTSMAAPHVAGAVALFLEREPSLSVGAVTQRLLGLSTKGAVGGVGPGTPNRLLRIPAASSAASGSASAAPTRDGATVDKGKAALPRPRILALHHDQDRLTFWFTGARNVKYELFGNGRLIAETRRRKITVRHANYQQRSVFALRAYTAVAKSGWSNKIFWHSYNHWIRPFRDDGARR